MMILMADADGMYIPAAFANFEIYVKYICTKWGSSSIQCTVHVHVLVQPHTHQAGRSGSAFIHHPDPGGKNLRK